jgi:hypothetical protein
MCVNCTWRTNRHPRTPTKGCLIGGNTQLNGGLADDTMTHHYTLLGDVITPDPDADAKAPFIE